MTIYQDEPPAHRSRRSRWIPWVVSLPLGILTFPLAGHLPLTHAQTAILRAAFAAYVLLLTMAGLVWMTCTLHHELTHEARPWRWGAGITMVGFYALFVPFVYMPISYLATGGIGNNALGVVMTAGVFLISATLIGMGLLVLLVELGMDPPHTNPPPD